MYSHHHHHHLFLARREQVEKGDLFFLSLRVSSFLHDCNVCVYTRGFLTEKYMCLTLLSPIPLKYNRDAHVLVRIPQNYSHSLYSLCVFVYVISTVYLFFSVFVHFPFLTDGAAESHGGDVEIFCPLCLDVRARKRGRSQGFLRLISWSSTRDG